MARAGGGGRRRTVLHIDLDCFYCVRTQGG